MRIAKEQVDVRMQIPGAVLRQQMNFGNMSGQNQISAEYFSLAAGVDTTPLFVGLTDDACQCPHWGYVLQGELTTTDVYGVQETVSANDLFFWPAGHNVKVLADAEIIMFSPQHAHAEVIDHMKRKGGQLTPNPTRQRLLDVGLALLLEQGYHGLGIQALLTAANAPKGSFDHHFADKEDFALKVIDQYMNAVHAGLDACLTNSTRPPLERVRAFFEMTAQSYRQEGYLGCLLGGLGQELSGANPVFRERIERCFTEISNRTAACLEEARLQGDLAHDADTRAMASLLVDCWEGAALRSRLRGSAEPLLAMLDFYFHSAAAPR